MGDNVISLENRRSASEQRDVLLRGASAALDRVGDVLDGVRERIAAADAKYAARRQQPRPLVIAK